MKSLLLLVATGVAALAQVHPTLDFETHSGKLTLTAVQHASLMLQAGGQVVLVDPVGAAFERLPKADLILITDIHGDHLSAPTIALSSKSTTRILAAPAAAKQLEGAQALAGGESAQVGAWGIEAVPAYNLVRGPAQGKLYHEQGRGNGYVVTYGGFRLYIAGDTENIPEMKNLRKIDVALLPMNLPYTMTPEEAAAAAKVIHPKMAIPYHYRGSDLALFVKALAGSGIEAKILNWYH